MTSSPVRDLLRWLDDPSGFRRELTDGKWADFRNAVRERYGLDPERHGRLTVAQRLGARQGGLSEAWNVFEEDPESYPNLPELLEKADPAERTPSDDPSDDERTWPLRNRRQEDELRRALRDLEDLGDLENGAPEEALETLRRLEEEHGPRRGWVWARLGRSPLAEALPHLVRAADAAKRALEMVESEEDREAVRAVLRMG